MLRLQLRTVARVARAPRVCMPHYVRYLTVPTNTNPRGPTPAHVTFAKVHQSVNANDGTVLVDVREPHEYNAGHIPGAVNIPVGTVHEALSLPHDKFKHKYHIPKPAQSTKLVFYCLAGTRSTAASTCALACGYTQSVNYHGSWQDWVASGGPVAATS